MDRSLQRADRGGIVVGWLLKLTVVLLLVGIAAYDLISITYTRVTTADDARYIAMGASEAIVLQRADDAAAMAVARERAESRGVTLGKKDLDVADDGSVTVRVRRIADTAVVTHIGPLQHFTQIDEVFTSPTIRTS